MFIKWIKDFLRCIKPIKYRIVMAYIIMFISITIMGKIYVDTGTLTEVKIGVLDMLCDVHKNLGILGNTSYMIIIFIFSLSLISVLEYDNKKLCVIRSSSRKEIISRQFFYIVIMSFALMFTLIFLGYIVSSIFTGSLNNTWTSTDGTIYKLLNSPSNWNEISQNFSTYKILSYIFLSGFLGLTATGMLICILKMFMKNTYIVAIIILQMYASVFFDKISFIFKQMHIYMSNLVYPISILRNQVYLLALILLLYRLGSYFIEKKDFLDRN
ncbi:hypothetical protein SAMN04487886_12224 [Clostridium sp. DSM 8431]|uniref:hypothetical protein n=1 Tax=Clostridium sp. DSM 8431 TaxID=1761781 RepID=UPI0008E98FB3|nr:hypothetical protein [Clostridium sp. DSM 8431]SFU85106.1 hypothetical protein SAMN04487886_12224 [Clostridium sp. DSM 8431]